MRMTRHSFILTLDLLINILSKKKTFGERKRPLLGKLIFTTRDPFNRLRAKEEGAS